MEMFSMLKHHIVADGANPITEHFHLVCQVATAGQQHVWKIYDARRIKDGKVRNCLQINSLFPSNYIKTRARQLL